MIYDKISANALGVVGGHNRVLAVYLRSYDSGIYNCLSISEGQRSCEIRERGLIYNQLKRYIVVQLSYWLRRATHWVRMKHIEQGRDWRFYEQYSIIEILKMKLNGTEEQKMKIWSHIRR